ncbi:MAG: porin family protein [bacterium]|jgi:hypothetical protein
MKKAILVFATVLISTVMFGQFHFGPQVGYTASNLSVDKSEIVNNLKSNLLIGVFVRMGKKIYLQPEANWLTQGGTFKYEFEVDDPNPVEQEIKLNTLQVPLSLGWRMINLNVINIRLFAGASANFILNTKINTFNPDTYEYLLPEDFSSIQWQWQAGLGVDILMFAIDVRYCGGINDLVNKTVTVDGGNYQVSSKSNLFQVTLGWKIF